MDNTIKMYLIDEILEDSHPVGVEYIILEALSEYKEKHKTTWGGCIANSIVQRVEDYNKGQQIPIMNYDVIDKLFE